jgi:hypothetical protein
MQPRCGVGIGDWSQPIGDRRSISATEASHVNDITLSIHAISLQYSSLGIPI